MNLLDILFPKRKQEKEELKNLEPEIKNLEITLGLYGRTNTEVYYDPLYERNRGRIYDLKGRKEYLEDLKKDNIKTAVGSNLTTEYNYKNDTININNIHRKNPYTILHEVGHRVSDNREQLRGGKYYGNYRSLDKKVNTSHNLHNSIMNNVGNLSTLMNEANASYHAAALAKNIIFPEKCKKQEIKV